MIRIYKKGQRVNIRKWFSRLGVLLTVLTMLALNAGSTWAQGPGEPDILNRPEEPSKLASFNTGTYNFLAIGVPYEDVSY